MKKITRNREGNARVRGNLCATAAFLLLVLPSASLAQTYNNDSQNHDDELFDERSDDREEQMNDADEDSDAEEEAEKMKIYVTAKECRSLLSPGAFSVRLREDRREWMKMHTAERGLEAWLLSNRLYLQREREERKLHAKMVVSCNRFRNQLDVVSLDRPRIVVFSATSPYFLPGRLTRTGGGTSDKNDPLIQSTDQALGMTRTSARNAASYFGWLNDTEHPTKRTIKIEAHEEARTRRLLR